MNSTHSYWNGFAIATLLLSLMACTPAITPTSALIPVTIQLSWTHSSQFAGYYVADQLGYYTSEGLTVTFIEGGPTVDRLKAVLDGSAQFGIASGSNLIEGRAAGNQIVGIAAILRRDPFAFFALTSSGITRPQDFVGKIIQVRVRARPILYPMLARVGVTPEQITEANDAAFDDLYTGKVDIGTGFVTTQLVDAQRAGYKLNVIYPDDYGVHSLSDLIFATDAFPAQNHDLTLRFLRATLKGWTYTVENPVQAAAFVAKYKPDADLSYETETLTASLPYINTGEDHIGWMKPEIWVGMEQTLQEQGVLTKPVDVTEIYMLQFLNEIYRP